MVGLKRCIRCDALIDDAGQIVNERTKYVFLQAYCLKVGHTLEPREMWEAYREPRPIPYPTKPDLPAVSS